MARTLVIHPGALGDVLLAIPALRALRRGPRGVEVAIAAQSHVGALLHGLDEVDAYQRFDALGLDALFADVPAPPALVRALGDVDHVVCWFGARDAQFADRLRAIVPSAVIARSVPDTGTVWEHLVLTAARGTEADRTPVRVPSALVDDGRQALEAAGWAGERPLLVVHPGASGPAKEWPVDRFAHVIEPLTERFAVAVHEGPTDRDAARGLRDRLSGAVLHLDQPSLSVLAGALVHASAYLGNDSGVSHLAAAVGVPSVVLFRSDALPWAPWASGVEVVAVDTTTRSADENTHEAAAAMARRCVIG
jgi:lipopolysaccharide heptosyltransferase III